MQSTPMNAPTGLRLAHSVEQALIGALLQQPDAVPGVRLLVRPDAIEDEALRVIYQAILDQADTRGEIAPLAVAARLEQGNRLDQAGGFAGVIELAANTIPGSNTMAYARMVSQHDNRRKLAILGEKLAEHAHSQQAPADLARAAISALRDIERVSDQDACAELVLTFADLAAKHAHTQWAVKGVIPQGALGMFFGASGTFKSFIALDYALHRSYGMPWLGRKTAQSNPVYIAAEGGAGIVKRVRAWHQARHMPIEDLQMRFVDVPMPVLTDAGRLRERLETLKFAPGDIIIDTLSQTFSGEENSASDMSAYLRAVGSELRDPFGATCTVIHHTGHAVTERPRGSSAIQANTDFLFGVFRDGPESMMAVLDCQKQKDGDTCAPVSFVLRATQIGMDEDGDPVSSLVARHASVSDVLAQLDASTSESPLKRLVNAVGYGATEDAVRDSFYKAMGDAEKDAKRQAYHRALKSAIAQKIVSREGDLLVCAAQQYGQIKG